MAKVHESLRIEEAIAERVKAQAKDGESKAATYGRVLEAGLETLEGVTDHSAQEEQTERVAEEASAGEVEALRDYVETLKAQVEVKDRQIETLTRITEQAQTLHAFTERKSLEQPQEQRPKERRSLWQRIFGDTEQEG